MNKTKTGGGSGVFEKKKFMQDKKRRHKLTKMTLFLTRLFNPLLTLRYYEIQYSSF
jgi:preprotein translocase subunit SecG